MVLVDNPLFMRIMADVGFGLIVGTAVGYVVDNERRDYWAIGSAMAMLTIDFGHFGHFGKEHFFLSKNIGFGRSFPIRCDGTEDVMIVPTRNYNCNYGGIPQTTIF